MKISKPLPTKGFFEVEIFFSNFQIGPESMVFYVWEKNGSIFGQIASKNLSLCPWEITKKSFRRKGLKICHFSTLWIWKFGIFDNRPQGCDEVKNSMGLLQGPRWPGPQKVQCREITGFPWVVELFLALLNGWPHKVLLLDSVSSERYTCTTTVQLLRFKID